MDNKNELEKTLKRISSDIKDLKFRQAIGGDSWVVYRQEVNYSMTAGNKFKVEFTPNTPGDFVASAWITNPDRTIRGDQTAIFPDQNVKGVWWVAETVGGTVPRTIFVYSTKRGTLVITLVE